MDLIIRIVIGGLAGWLTGKAADDEGYSTVLTSTHRKLLDTLYGIIGALMGHYLFFWIVIGKGSAFSDYATAVLGAITIVGLARLVSRARSSASS